MLEPSDGTRVKTQKQITKNFNSRFCRYFLLLCHYLWSELHPIAYKASTTFQAFSGYKSSILDEQLGNYLSHGRKPSSGPLSQLPWYLHINPRDIMLPRLASGGSCLLGPQ
jgi:hypothetical protein